MMILHKMVEKIVKNKWRNCGTRSTFLLPLLHLKFNIVTFSSFIFHQFNTTSHDESQTF